MTKRLQKISLLSITVMDFAVWDHGREDYYIKEDGTIPTFETKEEAEHYLQSMEPDTSGPVSYTHLEESTEQTPGERETDVSTEENTENSTEGSTERSSSPTRNAPEESIVRRSKVNMMSS